MKLIQVLADKGNADTLEGIGEQQAVADCWISPPDEHGRVMAQFIVEAASVQPVLDLLQHVLETAESAKIAVLATEAVLPRPKKSEEDEKRERRQSMTASREALYDSVAKSARLDMNYLLLVFLSTIVAAIGLIEDNIGVVIGAMVIAPLLGPNLALALGTALGDTSLMWLALRTTLAGLGLALGMSLVIGWLWPINLESHELVSRTDVGLDSIALALASGAAAVLSVTTGLPAVLVGVMVAVALLPPTATFGLMLGAQQPGLAVGAGLLLAVNVVCVNLAAKVVFLAKGVRPRTWLEKEKARQSMVLYLTLWIASLLLLVGVIYLRG